MKEHGYKHEKEKSIWAAFAAGFPERACVCISGGTVKRETYGILYLASDCLCGFICLFNGRIFSDRRAPGEFVWILFYF